MRRLLAAIARRLQIHPAVDVSAVRQSQLELEACADAGRAAAEAALPRMSCDHRWELIALSGTRRDYQCRRCLAPLQSFAVLYVDEDGFEARAWPLLPQ